MEILNDFGIDKYLLVAQIINFLIIAYILKRFAYKPILKLLSDRKQAIEQGLQQAEEARKLLEQASNKETALLKNAQLLAKKMQDDAKKQSEEILRKTEEEAKKRSEQILLQTQEKIAQETREAEKRLEKHITEIAIAILQKAVSNLFTPIEQKAVLDKVAKSFDKLKTKS